MSDLIETALAIALDAYAGQKDKAGQTYMLHPLRLMAKMSSPTEMATAILHDVIEDSDWTAKKLLEKGIPGEVVDAVQLLSKQSGDKYEDFVNRCKTNPLARKIKIADLEDNINVLRIPELTEKDLQRVAKYHEAWHSLQDNNL